MGGLLYDHADSGWSTYFKVQEFFLILSAINGAVNESKLGHGLAYSKFTSEFRNEIMQLPSRIGMFIAYTPAAFIAAYFFANELTGKRENDIGSPKVFLLSTAICVHFVKRVLETLFLHRYSGKAGLSPMVMISAGFAMGALNLNWAQQESERLTPPALDLTRVGVVLFLIGILGNFYHHLLLRGLRKGGERKYVIPEGGLFGVFVAPHYVFEIVEFAGIASIAQTYYAASYLTFVVIYLVSRSYSTKKWYWKKVDRFPRDRCVLIPYVF